MLWLTLAARGADPTSTPVLQEHRQAPDYGRPSRRVGPAEAALWGPRVLLAPVWFVERYVLYEPIRAIARVAERRKTR